MRESYWAGKKPFFQLNLQSWKTIVLLMQFCHLIQIDVLHYFGIFTKTQKKRIGENKKWIFQKVKNNQIKIADLIFEWGDNDSTKMKQQCHYLRTQKHDGDGLHHTINILLEIRVTATHRFNLFDACIFNLGIRIM